LNYLEAPFESYLVGRPATFEYINQHHVYLLFDFLYGFLTFGFWCSVYLGFHFLEERRRAEKESWRLAAALSRARLDALRAQVNPHFLFNALNSLRALIDENPAQARDAVTRLASILRYSNLSCSVSRIGSRSGNSSNPRRWNGRFLQCFCKPWLKTL
jgi:hypothetical protein